MSAKLQEKSSQLSNSRSQLIALARLLDLVDAETARRLVTQARNAPDLARETQREALQYLIDTEILTRPKLQVLNDFVAELNVDLSRLAANRGDARDHRLALVGGGGAPAAEVSDPSVAAVHSFDEVTADESPPSGGRRSRDSSHSSHGRSSRARNEKRKYEEEFYSWDRPGITTNAMQIVQRSSRTVAAVAKYWGEAIQDWIMENLLSAALIVLCFLVAIFGLATWFYYSRSDDPSEMSQPAVELTIPEVEEDEPESNRLVQLREQVESGDFDDALEFLKELRESDAAVGRDSLDLAGLETSLIMGQARQLKWESGGRAAWRESGRMLLENPDIDSEVWRLQFATWLSRANAEDTDLAMQKLVVEASVKSATTYQLKAWLQVRKGEFDTAIRLLSGFEHDQCEIGDLLYRASAEFFTADWEAANEDLAALRARLDEPTELTIHQLLCYPQIREIAEKLSGLLESKKVQEAPPSGITETSVE